MCQAHPVPSVALDWALGMVLASPFGGIVTNLKKNEKKHQKSEKKRKKKRTCQISMFQEYQDVPGTSNALYCININAGGCGSIAIVGDIAEKEGRKSEIKWFVCCCVVNKKVVTCFMRFRIENVTWSHMTSFYNEKTSKKRKKRRKQGKFAT